MPLIEAAFRRAQEKAFNARRIDGMEVTYDRALIEAYLSDPKTEGALAFKLGGVLPPGSPHPTKLAPFVLQAIGAKEAP